MPKLLSIVGINTPEGKILLRKAEPIDQQRIAAPEIQELIGDMMLTYKTANLVGLAAPQVGRPERIVVVSSQPRPGYRNAAVVEPFAMINPVILDYSAENVKGWEGCGSLKNARGYPRARIWRSKEVAVAFHDGDGNLQKKTFEGFLARVIQHEIDHLEGIMFTDRKAPGDRLYEEDEWKLLIAEEEKQ